MPSPETEPGTANGEDPGLLLARPAGTPPPDDTPDAAVAASRTRRPLWLGIVLGLCVALPVLLTLASALTSPPHVRGVPVGRLIYLEADEPSDHTALLRGLRVMGPDGASRQILHETEPQDRDAGSREWISQPAASPDGRWLAFEKQVITLQEEEQSIDNQLWVMPLSGPGPPRMLLDLTRHKLKQFVGLTWTPDGRQIVFLNDAFEYKVAVDDGAATSSRLPGIDTMPPLRTRPDMSATRNPVLLPHSGSPETVFITDRQTALRAASPDGSRLAGTLPPGVRVTSPQNLVSIGQVGATAGPQYSHTLRWGWSVFGGRHITALKWSPDGRYLAYSVSKPPLEDELFYLNVVTGKCFQLPVRTGRAGWDWAR